MAKAPSRTAPTARLADSALPPLQPDSPVWPDRTVRAGGVELCIRRAAATVDDAEPALMVHGLGGSALNWTDLAELLRSRLDVECLDLPGHGYSGPAPRRDYSQRAHARAVIAYLERSDRGPVHLVGNSMGGAVSLRVAASRPDLVRTLTLISPAVPDVRRLRAHPLKYNPLMAVLMLPGLGGLALRRLSRTAVEGRVKATLELCFGDASRYPKTRFEQDVRETRDRLGMHWANDAMLGSMRGLAWDQFVRSRTVWRSITKVQAPTLVIWGDRDRLVAPDLVGYVAAAIEHSRQLVLDGVGHVAMMEDPMTCARAIVALLDDVAAA